MLDLWRQCLYQVGYSHVQRVQNYIRDSHTSSTLPCNPPLSGNLISDLPSNDLPYISPGLISGEDHWQGKTDHWRPRQIAKLKLKKDHRLHNNEQRQYRKKYPNRNHLLSKYAVKHQKYRPLQQPPSRQARFHSQKLGGRS
jgi:hypothetical protein